MDYARARATALRLISNFGNSGKALFYRRSVNFDPLTGDETSTEAEHTIEVVVLPDRDASIATGSVMDFDVRFMVPATGLSIEPQPGDEVSLPGRSGRFGIVDPVEKMAPDGTNIAFTCMGRRIG